MLRALWPFDGSARMAVFTVHEPPGAGGTRLERAESLAFIRDGFSWRTALFSPVYLVLRGEWLALAAYAAAAIVAAAVLWLAGAENQWYGWTFMLLNVVAGFEANEIERWSLARAGWREIGTVSGRGHEEAERRFFDAWLPTLPADAPGETPHLSSGPAPAPRSDVVAHVESALHRLSAWLRRPFAAKT